MKEKRKIIILLSVILGVLVVILGLTYALFTYDRVGTNGNLVLGDIYFHYNETDKFINIKNAMPRKLIADDFVSSKKLLNPIMKSQILMTAEDLEGNELTKCVNYFTMKFAKMTMGGEIDYKSVCQGGPIDGQTFEEYFSNVVSEGLFTTEDVNDMLNLNIITSSGDSYIRNTIMDNQEFDDRQIINELTICNSFSDFMTILGAFQIQEGETSEAFCRGIGTLGGLTYREHVVNKSPFSQMLDVYAGYFEELKNLIAFDKTLLDIDLPFFEFTIDGKNTYSDKNIEYEIVLNNTEYNGEDKETRNERIDDKFLKFALVEVIDEEESIKFHNKSFSELNNTTIFTDSILSSDGEINKTYRLYMWIGDEVVIGGGDAEYDYDTEIWNNKIYASVKVDINANFVPKDVSNQPEVATDSASFKRIANNKGTTYVDTDGTVYLTGTNNEVNYNYVLYSGKLWRIVSINPDGTMKLITDDSITSLAWGENTTYETSYIRQWLNQEFLPTLYNYENIIKMDSKWDITPSSTNTPIKSDNPVLIEDMVGLLSSYEYSKIIINSFKNNEANSNYLVIGKHWFSITSRDNENIWYIVSDGVLEYVDLSIEREVRPVINLKSSIKFTGNGTELEPYVIGFAS